MNINSDTAYVIYALSMIGAFIWSTFYKDAQFQAFSVAMSAGFIGYLEKRLRQRQSKYGGLQPVQPPIACEEVVDAPVVR